jgi:hypothetical protein
VTNQCQHWTTTPKGNEKETVPPGADGKKFGSCFEKTKDSSKNKIEFMSNKDVAGYGPTNLLFALFPTKERFGMCLPDESVGK